MPNSFRISKLDDEGDLSAEPGSKKWAVAMVRRIKTQMKALDSDVSHVKTLLSLARDKGAYKALGYPSFEIMAAKECRIETDILDRIFEAKKGTSIGLVIGKPGQYGRGRPKPDRGDDVTSNRGNQTSYLIARLERDATDDPEFAEIKRRFEAGEFASVRQMGIAAGYVKEPTAYDLLCRAWKKATPSERKQFIEYTQSTDA